jgi:hypothetical protein
MDKPMPEYETLPPVFRFFRAYPHLILNLAFIARFRRKRFGKILSFGKCSKFIRSFPWFLGLSDGLKPFWKGAAVVLKLFKKILRYSNRVLESTKKLSKILTIY